MQRAKKSLYHLKFTHNLTTMRLWRSNMTATLNADKTDKANYML